jgi:curved DNA-binding protein CbpA
MDDPYEVLGLPCDSTDEQIRRRYLELVRQHPPDRDPERFAKVRAAYDRLRDPVVRLESQLFGETRDDSLDAVLLEVQRRLRTARLPLKTLLSLAEQS